MSALCILVGLHAIYTGHSMEITEGVRKNMEGMKEHPEFVRNAAPPSTTIHEVVIAIKQLNLDVLSMELRDRSTPKSNKYQKWLTYDQIGKITSNPLGARATIKYLKARNVSINNISTRKDYIHASASLATWETVLGTNFYNYNHVKKQTDMKSATHNPITYIRTPKYSLPQDLSEHVSHIFNTVELPPVLTFNDGKVQLREKKTYDTKNSEINHENKDSKIDHMVDDNRVRAVRKKMVFEKDDKNKHYSKSKEKKSQNQNSVKGNFKIPPQKINVEKDVHEKQLKNGGKERNLKKEVVKEKVAEKSKYKVEEKVKNQAKDVKNTDVKKTEKMSTNQVAGQDVTVQFLNNYYSISSNEGSSSLTQSVFETNNQYFSPNDLNIFQQHYGLNIQSAEIIGGYETSTCSITSGTGNDCFEANLDTQYIMGIAQKTNTKVWHVSSDNGQDPFLSFILAVASDPYPPSVNSISWGTDEQTMSVSTMESFNIEAQKLGLMGVTILVSSGDNGVTGYGCKYGCDLQSTVSVNNCVCNVSSSTDSSFWDTTTNGNTNVWSGTGYAPKFPATCPYITAVGGTAGPELGQSEVSAQSDKLNVITSGGGFSGHFIQPTWQNSVVDNYFSGLSTSPLSGYNNKGRGYPDISLLSVNYIVVIQGNFFNMYGTSASTPALAGMISVINAQRQLNGKSTIGFINPTIYASQNSGKFNDIISGTNKCCSSGGNTVSGSNPYCCDSGFEATTGWDPVTGLGSVNYTNLYSMFA